MDERTEQGRRFLMGYRDDDTTEFVSDQEKKLPQPPLCKAPMGGERTVLPRDFSALPEGSGLYDLLTRRRSARIYTEGELSLLQLSFLLWATQGVRAMSLGEDDYLVDMLVVKPDCEILTLTSNGYGKRSDPEDYRLQGRAGKGIKAGVFNEKTGYLVNLKIVNENEDIMIISNNGTIIRMHVSDISKIGRNTQGVRVMRLKDSAVATVAVAPREEEDEETALDAELAEGAEGTAAQQAEGETPSDVSAETESEE